MSSRCWLSRDRCRTGGGYGRTAGWDVRLGRTYRCRFSKIRTEAWRRTSSPTELCIAPKLRVVLIRPAWLIHGPGQSLEMEALNNWIPLSWRFRRGTYIGSDENRYSAIHLEDLAELYCLALWRGRETNQCDGAHAPTTMTTGTRARSLER